MYQEWMDGVPLLISGCYDNNISELQKAVSYYKRHGMDTEVEIYEEAINNERIEQQRKMKEPNKFIQIMNIIFS